MDRSRQPGLSAPLEQFRFCCWSAILEVFAADSRQPRLCAVFPTRFLLISLFGGSLRMSSDNGHKETPAVRPGLFQLRKERGYFYGSDYTTRLCSNYGMQLKKQLNFLRKTDCVLTVFECGRSPAVQLAAAADSAFGPAPRRTAAAAAESASGPAPWIRTAPSKIDGAKK